MHWSDLFSPVLAKCCLDMMMVEDITSTFTTPLKHPEAIFTIRDQMENIVYEISIRHIVI